MYYIRNEYNIHIIRINLIIRVIHNIYIFYNIRDI